MNAFARRFFMILHRLDRLHWTGKLSRIQLPFSRPVGRVTIACLAALIFAHGVVHPLVAPHFVWWVGPLAYTLFPLTTCMVILSRIDWHAGSSESERLLSMLLWSMVIWGALLVLAAASVTVLLFCSLAVPKVGAR